LLTTGAGVDAELVLAAFWSQAVTKSAVLTTSKGMKVFFITEFL
jgi:hypothetical protein